MGIFDNIKKIRTKSQDSDQKYAISLISGHYEMRPPDINLWCIGNDYRPCLVVIPLPAWERMNSIITLTVSEQWNRLSLQNSNHSQEQKNIISVTNVENGEETSNEETRIVNCGFKNLYSDTPIFLPVLMSITVFNNYFVPLEHCLRNYSIPPKSIAQILLENAEFVENNDDFIIPLIRRSKNIIRCDKYSLSPNGDKIEIFETYS